MNKYQFGNYETGVEITLNRNLRHYKLYSSAPKRAENNFGDVREFSEKDELPFLRSSSPLFDSLFALCLHETELNKVDKISDWSFEAENQCVFETGELWNYVWTRDSSYSAHLGLGIIDPKRMLRTLLFKVSKERKGQKSYFVQDTGSGGAWPISSDRVVLALGMRKVAPLLNAEDRKQLELQLFETMENTVIIDREVVFDSKAGLYRGEESFLDWREQSYPFWTANDTLWIGRSKALSTNLCHYAILSYLNELTIKYKKKTSANYELWATELKNKINERFYDEESGLYRSILMDNFLVEPLKCFDLLGNALAVRLGVAEDDRAKCVVASYPYTEVGAPVIFPQSREVPIYHNRAIWPFVSAYALQAAKRVGNAVAVAKNAETLIQGAATQLSNMENFEFLTLLPHVDDGKNSGPVVNSRRQLWSVAAYLNMVIEGFFGIKFREKYCSLNPYLPASLCQRYFSERSQIELHNLPWEDKKMNVRLYLPELKGKAEGSLTAKKICFQGKEVSSNRIERLKLEDHNLVEIYLEYQEDYSSINLIKIHNPKNISQEDEKKFFAPIEPRFSLNEDNSEVSFEPSNLNILIYRNGKLAETVKGGETIEVEKHIAQTLSFVAQDPLSGNHSFPTQPMDFNYRWQLFDFKGDRLSGQPQFLPAESKLPELTSDYILPIRVSESGTYRVELLYLNPGPINTGITGCLKRVSTKLGAKMLKQDIVIMPHTGDQGHIRISSSLELQLNKDENYELSIEDFTNMSDLIHFENYKNRGGRKGRENKAFLFGCRLKKISGV